MTDELQQQYEQHKEQSRTALEIKVGHKVADAVAEELVKNIRIQGLFAQRGFAPPHGNRRILVIKGQFLTIDEGTLTGVNDADYKPPFALTAKLNKLTIEVDRPQLSPADIEKLKTAMRNNKMSE